MNATHYKLISTRAKWFGVDFFDAVLIVVAFAVIHLLTSALLFDLIASFCLYVGARILKASKPDRWLLDSLRFYLRSPYYDAAKRTEGDHVVG